MKQQISLEFRKDLTKLAGNQFGKSTFANQVESKIDYSAEQICITIPERIDRIASSFIQGFFEKIINEIGIRGIQEKVFVISSIHNINEYIIDNLR